MCVCVRICVYMYMCIYVQEGEYSSSKYDYDGIHLRASARNIVST